MTKVAYKVNTNNPNLPVGFIMDHFETDQDAVPGYLVVDSNTFNLLLQNNVTLLRQHEVNKGVQAAPHDAPPHAQRPASEAEPVDSALMNAKKAEMDKRISENAANQELFQQFLAWKKSQESNS